MILNSKYGEVIIYAKTIEQEALSQIVAMANSPIGENAHIRIMPDCHAGKGCVIGTTMRLTDRCVPNLVGVDIGCGMLAAKLEETNIDCEKLDKVINTYIPSGFDIHDKAVSKSRADEIYAPISVDKAMRSLGTLGGGNHFIEVNRDSEGCLWLVVHTGSRHLGVEVCNYYQELAWKKTKNNGIDTKIKNVVEELKALGRQSEIDAAVKELRANNSPIPKELCYVEGEDFTNYIHDMYFAQKHATINRKVIVEQIINRMNWHIAEVFETVHNYIDTENMILRKGAVSAELNELLIIPMNMRDGSLICRGKGNPEWNYSAPHGAGRLMSRSKAKETVSLDDFKLSMQGIYTTSVNASTIDESPMAYKPASEILECIEDTVEVLDIIKPVYNFKAH